jgi:6-phospho-3-hexuloisomerase
VNTTEYAKIITQELETSLSKVSSEAGEDLTNLILKADKILVAGAGRSGFAIKAFAMRLMHMGFAANVVGETVTPDLAAADVFIIGSGSGETGSLVSMAGKAKGIGAAVALITTRPESPIGKAADLVVKIPVSTPKAAVGGTFKSIQPMGSLFEQCLLVFLDAVVLRLMEKQGHTSETMFARHANLE